MQRPPRRNQLHFTVPNSDIRLREVYLGSLTPSRCPLNFLAKNLVLLRPHCEQLVVHPIERSLPTSEFATLGAVGSGP